MGFRIELGKNGYYYVKLFGSNNQLILKSEGYLTNLACLNGIESIRVSLQREDSIERKQSTQGKYYFYLKAVNGQILGTSPYYESITERENGIGSVIKNSFSQDIRE